jgi:acetyltransferase-like isoleucine patch superfamily enzyme
MVMGLRGFRRKPLQNDETKTLSVGSSELRVGRFTYGHENIQVREWGEGRHVSIGAFCSIADKIQIFLGGNHRTDWISTFPFGHVYTEELGGTHIVGHPRSKGDVTIGNDVWIASGVTILSGVSIADGAVIGANSTVTHDVGPYEIHAGNPAGLIRKRFSDEIIGLLCSLRWWELPVAEIIKIQDILSAEPDAKSLNELLELYRA